MIYLLILLLKQSPLQELAVIESPNTVDKHGYQHETSIQTLLTVLSLLQ